MSAAKHTAAQAPWCVYGSVLKDANGNSIASGGNNRVITGQTLTDSLTLAAAAPELLSVLQEADDRPLITEGVDWWIRVRAAIAKATGQQTDPTR